MRTTLFGGGGKGGRGGMRPARHCAGGGISRGEKRLKQTCISFKRSKCSKVVEMIME